MPTYSKSGSFGWAGGGKSGAVVDLWAANRFAAFPSEDEAPPIGNPDAGPVTTGSAEGNPGAYLIAGITVLQDYYVRVQYGNHFYWGACPEGTLLGATGGGGGRSPNDLTVTPFPITFTAEGSLFPLFTPNQGDVLMDFWFEIVTAFNGLTPQLDIGAFVFTNQGILAATSLAPFPLWTADIHSSSVAFLVGAGASSLSSAMLSAALTNGPPVQRWQMTFNHAGLPIYAVISQDGSNTPVSSALIVASSPPATPLTFTSSNNRFQYQGTSATTGGGGGVLETFTIPVGGPYTTVAQCATAMGTATGSVSGELFSTVATVTTFGNIIVEALFPGAAGNGNQLISAANDALGPLGFPQPAILSGGAGGNPGSSQGSGILYVVTATP